MMALPARGPGGGARRQGAEGSRPRAAPRTPGPVLALHQDGMDQEMHRQRPRRRLPVDLRRRPDSGVPRVFRPPDLGAGPTATSSCTGSRPHLRDQLLRPVQRRLAKWPRWVSSSYLFRWTRRASRCLRLHLEERPRGHDGRNLRRSSIPPKKSWRYPDLRQHASGSDSASMCDGLDDTPPSSTPSWAHEPWRTSRVSGPMVLPSGFAQLRRADRLLRGRQPEAGDRGCRLSRLTAALNKNTQQGADDAAISDTGMPRPRRLIGQRVVQRLDAVYGWMSLDGLDSGDLDSMHRGAPGCGSPQGHPQQGFGRRQPGHRRHLDERQR